MNTQQNDDHLRASCNVNTKFNFTVGALAIAVALLIGFFVFLA